MFVETPKICLLYNTISGHPKKNEMEKSQNCGRNIEKTVQILEAFSQFNYYRDSYSNTQTLWSNGISLDFPTGEVSTSGSGISVNFQDFVINFFKK